MATLSPEQLRYIALAGLAVGGLGIATVIVRDPSPSPEPRTAPPPYSGFAQVYVDPVYGCQYLIFSNSVQPRVRMSPVGGAVQVCALRDATTPRPAEESR